MGKANGEGCRFKLLCDLGGVFGSLRARIGSVKNRVFGLHDVLGRWVLPCTVSTTPCPMPSCDTRSRQAYFLYSVIIRVSAAAQITSHSVM